MINIIITARLVIFVSLISLYQSCNENSKKIADKSVDEIVENQWELVLSKDGSEPVKRHEAAFVKVNEKFYLLGGRGIRNVSIYDPKTGSWSLGSKPPIEMHHFQPIVYQNEIYLVGVMTGKYPAETPVSHIYTYNPSADTWSKGDEIPEKRRRGSSGNVLYNGKIYMTCGIKNGHIGDHKNWTDSYDLETGEWKILADAPRARDHFQSVLVDNTIYALAGRNTKSDEGPFKNTLAQVDVYDITKNTWKTLPNNLPTLRAGNAATLFNGEIVVVGGESHNQVKAHSEVEALNPKTKEWRNLPFLKVGRHGSGLLEHEGMLYIASGCGNQGGSPELTSMERLGN